MTPFAKNMKEYQAVCEKQYNEIAELKAKVRWLEEQFALAQHKIFGKSSEKTSDEQQALIFNEAELEAIPVDEPTVETITYKRRKAKGHRELQIKNLPVKQEFHELPEDQRICPCCANPLHEMRTEVRQELHIIPAQAYIQEDIRSIYSCRYCDKNEISTPIIPAPMPKPAFPKSLASASSVSFIMSQKFVEGLPLYRQEQSMARLGIELSRQTTANWMIRGVEDWLVHIYQRMHNHLIKRDILHADETTLQVVKEPGREAKNKSYMWLYRTGREGPPIVLFDYQKTRSAEHPKAFLQGFRGYLLTDAYSAYDAMVNYLAESPTSIRLLNCWAHARRYFNDALIALKGSAKSNSSYAVPYLTQASQGLDFCNKLFDIERELHDATPAERYVGRLKKSKPVLNAFKLWLDEQSTKSLPKSAFGKAISYCLNQWEKLNVFLEDGRLEIDNNRSERSFKPFVIGRKNWLFSFTPRGATSSAIIYSIVETAKENGLDPRKYLQYLFEKMPQINLKNEKALDELLPWSESISAECKVPEKLTA